MKLNQYPSKALIGIRICGLQKYIPSNPYPPTLTYDCTVLVNFLVCFLLDLVVLGQCAYYGSAPPKKID